MTKADKPSVESIFITFRDIIQTPYLKVLKFIEEHPDDFYELFEVEDIPKKDIEKMGWLVMRDNKNPVAELADFEFDYDAVLKQIEFDVGRELYEPTEGCGTTFGDLTNLLSAHTVTKEIVFYSEDYDPRIEAYIKGLKLKGTVAYEHGEFLKVIDKYSFTTYILNDMMYLHTLYLERLEKIKYTNVLISNHGYNYIYDPETEELTENWDLIESYENIMGVPVRVAFFPPYKIPEEGFNFIMGDLEEDLIKLKEKQASEHEDEDDN